MSHGRPGAFLVARGHHPLSSLPCPSPPSLEKKKIGGIGGGRYRNGSQRIGKGIGGGVPSQLANRADSHRIGRRMLRRTAEGLPRDAARDKGQGKGRKRGRKRVLPGDYGHVIRGRLGRAMEQVAGDRLGLSGETPLGARSAVGDENDSREPLKRPWRADRGCRNTNIPDHTREPRHGPFKPLWRAFRHGAERWVPGHRSNPPTKPRAPSAPGLPRAAHGEPRSKNPDGVTIGVGGWRGVRVRPWPAHSRARHGIAEP
jgi:hypothetical protein